MDKKTAFWFMPLLKNLKNGRVDSLLYRHFNLL